MAGTSSFPFRTVYLDSNNIDDAALQSLWATVSSHGWSELVTISLEGNVLTDAALAPLESLLLAPGGGPLAGLRDLLLSNPCGSGAASLNTFDCANPLAATNQLTWWLAMSTWYATGTTQNISIEMDCACA